MSDAELCTANDMARDAFRQIVADTEARTGQPFAPWVFATIARHRPSEINRTSQWLVTLRRWLDQPTGPPTDETRPGMIAGLAAFLELQTEEQRRGAVLH